MVFTAKIGKVFLQSILNLNLNHSQTNRFNKFRAQSLYRTMKIEAEKSDPGKKKINQQKIKWTDFIHFRTKIIIDMNRGGGGDKLTGG